MFCFFYLQKPGMEELTIWEQHTITLNKVSGWLFKSQIMTCFNWEVYVWYDNYVYVQTKFEVQTVFLWCISGVQFSVFVKASQTQK